MRTRLSLHLKVAMLAVGAFCILSTAPLQSQTVSEVYVFTNPVDGSEPDAPLVQGRDGKLYGTTEQGGVNTCSYLGNNIGCGTVFNLDTFGNLTVLHSFDGTDGFSPKGVILASDGNFYGATTLGGAYGFGALFRVSARGVFTKLHDFANTGDGEYPQDQLLQASDGNLYGFTETGLYRSTPSGTITSLYNFSPYPVTDNAASLVQATDGFLYATIVGGYYNGRTYPCGTILGFNLQGHKVFEHDFGCNQDQPSGNAPSSAVTQATDGNLYGTCWAGGTTGYGTAFKINPQINVLTVLHDYTADSEHPYAGLVQGTDGNFYGVVVYSTAAYSGTVDQLTPSGVYTEAGDLPYNGEDFPYWTLIQHTGGKFYGSSWFEEDSTGGYYGSIYSFDNGLAAFITFVRATGGVGSTVQILGQEFKGTTSVKFNGVPATSFSVLSATYLTAVVPTGATSGPVTVETSNRLFTSNKNFTVSSE